MLSLEPGARLAAMNELTLPGPVTTAPFTEMAPCPELASKFS